MSAETAAVSYRSARRSRSGSQAPERRFQPLALGEFRRSRRRGVAGCSRWSEEETRARLRGKAVPRMVRTN